MAFGKNSMHQNREEQAQAWVRLASRLENPTACLVNSGCSIVSAHAWSRGLRKRSQGSSKRGHDTVGQQDRASWAQRGACAKAWRWDGFCAWLGNHALSGWQGRGAVRAPGETRERRWGGTVGGGSGQRGRRRQDQISFPSLQLSKFLYTLPMYVIL